MMTDAIPAATVILIRDLPDTFEVLMIERHAKLSFAGGAMVFPGGRIDEDDHFIASRGDIVGDIAHLDPEDAAGRVAAVRETIEEVGLRVGLAASANIDIEVWRAALHARQPFSELLLTHGLTLELDALKQFARWHPKLNVPRVFDTRFYIARVPAGATDVGTADGDEATRLVWTTPRNALADAEAGRTLVIFPTKRNLERLAAHGSYAALSDHVDTIDLMKIRPQIKTIDGVDWLCIPEGQGYPVTRELAASAVRQ